MSQNARRAFSLGVTPTAGSEALQNDAQLKAKGREGRARIGRYASLWPVAQPGAVPGPQGQVIFYAARATTDVSDCSPLR